ncbi:hypothetical protein KR032_008835 [Drosophila birchii]|nr:hypothetical protein KR032_008835 [Drosophila birchii]
MKEKENKPNWAVEAVDPPPGTSSFCTFNALRDTRSKRRNPQFENEPTPGAPIPPIGNRSDSISRQPPAPEIPPTAPTDKQSESSSKRSQSPEIPSTPPIGNRPDSSSSGQQSPVMLPPAPTGKRSESGPRGFQSPMILGNGRDLKGKDKPGRRVSP